MKRVTWDQGTMTEVKNVEKCILTIEEKEYQEYRKDRKLRSNCYCLFYRKFSCAKSEFI